VAQEVVLDKPPTSKLFLPELEHSPFLYGVLLVAWVVYARCLSIFASQSECTLFAHYHTNAPSNTSHPSSPRKPRYGV